MNNSIDDVNGDCKDGILVQGIGWCVTQKMFESAIRERALEAYQPIGISNMPDFIHLDLVIHVFFRKDSGAGIKN